MTHAYLIKRNGKYHFRIRVPKELRSSIGTGEIHRSLGTSDNRLAQTLAGNLRAKVESEFAMLRHQRLLSLEHVVRPRPDDEVPRPPSRPTFATRATNERHQMPSTAIGQLIDEFAKDRQESWALKTKHMHLEVLRLFAGFVHNKPVAEINRQDCRDFKNTLAKLPPHWSRRYPGKSIDEIAELGRSPINPNTVNRRLIVITSFFNWALLEEYVDSNPAQRLRISTDRHPDNEREVFGQNDLRLLFEQSSLYRGCLSEKKRLTAGSLILRDSKFWVPLIALYSGLRLGEIAQLCQSDFRQVDGVWVFDVNGGQGRRLKNHSSKRLVPIHSMLIHIGLLDYADQIGGQGHQSLWPDLHRNALDAYSMALSRWFSHYKRSIGITNPKVTFHSFRHTVINHLKQADVSETKIKELVGHANESITTGRYGKRYHPVMLKEVVETLDYDLDWSHLSETPD